MVKAGWSTSTRLKIAALAIAAFLPAAAPAAQTARPNIVFILADDLGWADLGFNGSRYYETPNIDRLALQSVRFSRHYHAQNCTPTRAAILGGQWPTRTGIYTVDGLDRGEEVDRKMQVPVNRTELPLDRKTIADQLRQAGYVTGMFGKWHVGEEGEYHPSKRGFDEAIVTSGRHFDFRTRPLSEVQKDAYQADWLTDQAEAFLTRHKERPFFLYLPHFAVHTPLQAKKEMIERFAGKSSQGGQKNPTYAAMIASLDESVGRVLKKLDELKLAEKTIVLFASDNGGVGGYGDLANNITDNSPLRGGKGQHYEGGLRVPMLVRWPGVALPGATVETPTTHIDLFPTILEMAGAPKPPQLLDGLSLTPLLRDPSAPLRRKAIFAHLPGYLEGRGRSWRTTPVSTVIAGEWKLMEFLEDGRRELYNLREDLSEKNDVAAKERAKAAELASLLAEWRAQTGAAMPERKLPANSRGAPRPPNIIFILADDLGYGDIGSYGQTKIRTPHLDRLTREGMRFTRHYAGSPVCAPSRYVLLTGRHPGRAYIRDNREIQPEGQFPIPADTFTLGKLLQKRGYRTGAFGKWGLGGPGTEGEPLRQGFDHFYGYNCQRLAHNHYPTFLWDDNRRVSLRNEEFPAHQKLPQEADPKANETYARYRGMDFAPDLILDRALRFVRENRSRPFFLFVPTTVPHLALQAPEDSVQHYAGKWSDPPYSGDRSYLPNHSPRATYAAMISRMDRGIGKMMDLVRDLGLEEETIFVFTSDNGPLHDRLGGTDTEFFESARDLRGRKGSLYEGGVRVPLIVKWKGRIAAGAVSGRVTGFEDWLPTIMQLIGGAEDLPNDIYGIGFAPTLLGERQPDRDFLYREFAGYGGQQSVRLGEWVGIRQNLNPRRGESAPTVSTELYNLRDDPRQQRDVASRHPDVVARIERIMREQHQPSREFPLRALDGQGVKISYRADRLITSR